MSQGLRRIWGVAFYGACVFAALPASAQSQAPPSASSVAVSPTAKSPSAVRSSTGQPSTGQPSAVQPNSPPSSWLPTPHRGPYALPPIARRAPRLAANGGPYAEPVTQLQSPTALGFGIGLFSTAMSHVGLGLSIALEDCETGEICFNDVGTVLAVGGGIVAAGGLALIVVGAMPVEVYPADERASAQRSTAGPPLTLHVAAGPTGMKLLGEF